MAPETRTDIVSFLAPVNDSTVGRLIDLVCTAHDEGSTEIHIYISSIGGKLHSAFIAYHFLRSLRLPVYTHNIGTLENGGILVYLASDARSASPCAKFMLNNFEWTFYRDHIRYPEVAEAYKSLTFDVDAYCAVFEERTNRVLDVRGCLEGAPRIFGVDEALRAGMVTNPNIHAPGIPELAKIWSIHN